MRDLRISVFVAVARAMGLSPFDEMRRPAAARVPAGGHRRRGYKKTRHDELRIAKAQEKRDRRCQRRKADHFNQVKMMPLLHGSTGS